MGPRIAPMPVEIVLGKRRTRAGQFEQSVGRGNGDLGRQDLRFRRHDLRICDGFRRWLGDRLIDCEAGLFQQRLRGVETQRQVADGMDRVGIVPGIVDTPLSIQERLLVLMKLTVSSITACAMPVSTATWMIWTIAPSAVGLS